jgi:hypothetical protein
VNYYTSSNQTGSISSITSEPEIIVIDRWALIVYTVLFFAYQLGTLIWVYAVPSKRRRMMFKKDHENRLHLATRYDHIQTTITDTLRETKKTNN